MSDDAPKPITLPEGVESVLPEDAPRITLPLFEGPLDLLLYLIRRDQIDIHDIPIAPITRRYMEYLELMQQLNLDVAGEFMVMAATLIHIKSKMLVPIEPTEAQGEEEAVDPREELVQRLLEYRLYKEAAVGLGENEGVRRTLHERGNPPTEDDAGPLPLAPATLFDLLGALQRVMERRKEEPVYAVQTEGYDIEEMMSLLARTAAEDGQVRFSDVMRRARVRMEIIVSFMALLELIKLGTVTCVQEANFADILILPRLPERVGPDATGTPALGR